MYTFRSSPTGVDPGVLDVLENLRALDTLGDVDTLGKMGDLGDQDTWPRVIWVH